LVPGQKSSKKKKEQEREHLISKIATERRAGGGTHAVQHMFSKCKALSPIILHN
jgi:hypothetical protein